MIITGVTAAEVVPVIATALSVPQQRVRSMIWRALFDRQPAT
jgi:hypothetical protein